MDDLSFSFSFGLINFFFFPLFFSLLFFSFLGSLGRCSAN